MNRRQAAALLLYRRQKHHRYWVHPIDQSHQQFGKFHTLYKDLRKYPDRFYTYYRMSTEQFDYILAPIEHLIYKPKQTCGIVYLQKKNWQYVSGNYICYHLKAISPYCTYYHPLENNIVCRGYIQNSHRCLRIIFCINFNKFYDF